MRNRFSQLGAGGLITSGIFICALISGCGGGSTQSASVPVTNNTILEQEPEDPAVATPSSTSPIDQTAVSDQGAFNFVDNTEQSKIEFGFGFSTAFENDEVQWIAAHGVAAGDYDADGDVDLFIVRGDLGPNLLYRNDGNLVFAEVAESAGVGNTKTPTSNWRHGSPAFADVDGDGLLDLFLSGLGGDPNKLYKNDGDGTFTDVTAGSGFDQMKSAYTFSPAFGDYDLDGDIDLVVGHWGSPINYSSPPSETEHLWRNDTEGNNIKFTPVTARAGISPGILTISDSKITQRVFDNTFTPTFADFNDDGHPDLVMAADFNFSQVFTNNGNGTFSNTTDTDVIIDGNGMGSAVGDYDNDGRLDWFVSSIRATGDVPQHLSTLGNRLYRNNNDIFEDVSYDSGITAGGWGWGSCFLDIENDGDLDIYQTNGWPEWDELGPFSSDGTRVFVNQGNGIFHETAGELGLRDAEQGRGVVCADFDRDGDLDILLLHGNTENAATLWKNTNEGNFLSVRLKGKSPNTQAIGARITLESGGRWQLREMMLGNNFVSHNPAEQHFGLGDSTKIDILRIRWPDGSQTELTDIDANQHLIISQDEDTNTRLSVNHGSGSGFYEQGETVSISAVPSLDEHYNFSHWSSSNEELIENKYSNDTSITIPNSALDLMVVANYLPGPSASSELSVARRWNELTLQAIRNDFARPTVHARNLFHISAAMYDAWSFSDDVSIPWLLSKELDETDCAFSNLEAEADQKFIEEVISHTAYRILRHRFKNSPGKEQTYRDTDTLLKFLGYAPTETSSVTLSNASQLATTIADCYINYGMTDGANEADDYSNRFYEPVNPPLNPEFPGNPNILNLSRWQPLSLSTFIDQSGNTIESEPAFFGPEWGNVSSFALSETDLSTFERDGNRFNVYFDPGSPPDADGYLSDIFKWSMSLVAIWSSHLDPDDETLLDISPTSIGNITEYPSGFQEYDQFYKTFTGGDWGIGYAVNPHTAEPYQTQFVRRGDYARVLAEFWADGPDSETPPGHWFVILNSINDHPLLAKRLEGTGEVLDPLEWDIKSYFTLGGAMHDSAIAAWGSKGWYDSIRPISALRALSQLGQSTDPNLSNYHQDGLPLYPNYIESVEIGDELAGSNNENVGKIKFRTWRGPSYVSDPSTDYSGVGWILADNWWSYQRASFVTPPFAGYVSGHSTYSRAAAEVLRLITGSPFFPGGMSQFAVKQNEFLVFEKGPSEDMTLQWATFKDAADQCGLSRIWGGIHPPIDDIPGRLIGEQVGINAYTEARLYFDGVAQD